ncbi:MAG: hypothetical protein K8T89_15315 [Planctomycetes bacterium]|nr:hypothetical protein [Planctomycetota bacterium]
MKLVSQELSVFMGRHGYHKRSMGHFVMGEENLEKWITLTLSKWSNGTGFHVDHYAAYRLPAFAEIHNRYLHYVTEKEKKLIPTISTYFFNLVPKDFDWKEVTVVTESDIPAVARNIERICTLYSFPLLDKFATTDAIVEGFRGERNTWPEQDPILRFELLLLDDVLKHNTASFDRRFDEALQFCGSRTDGRAVWLSNLARSLKKDYLS